MRKYIFSLVVLILSITSFAHGKNENFFILPPDSSSSLVDRAAAVLLIDEGKQLLNSGKTRDALTKFRQAQIKDKYSSRSAYWIGRAHYNLSNYGYALKYAKQAEALSQAADGDVFFLLGQSYHRIAELDSARMNYDLAELQLSRAKKRVYNIGRLIEEIQFAEKMMAMETPWKRMLLKGPVNSGFDDYAPIKVPEMMKLYFVSRRPDTEGGELNPDDQRYFEDIYMAKWNEEEGIWDSITNELGKINSIGFDAVAHLADGGKRMYLTRNTAIVDMKDHTRSSDICVAEMSNQGRWNTPKPIRNKTINTSYFDGAPTLTADENTMYFVSDRRGEGHMSDIFVVERIGRKWGEAKPLPDKINTPGNETTPFITPDGKFLFYSSDGKIGMGGYDIYVTQNLGNGEWSDPINLGPEFNSVNNDTHFRFYPELKKAFLSSYRIQGEKASIDIYEMLLDGWDIPKAK
jgi:tetratricopeptide (TPR) repeat protein